MIKDYRVYLDDIIKSCELIASYTQDITKKEFEENIDKQDAVTRRLEIIGEAIKRLPMEFREKHPDIAWKKEKCNKSFSSNSCCFCRDYDASLYFTFFRSF